MNIEWEITSHDIDGVKAVVNTHWNSPFVQDRLRRNLAEKKPAVAQSRFWHALVAALLTTQQRSGPNSAASRFITKKPFPLSYQACLQQADSENFFVVTISSFGGIRRHGKIGSELWKNLCRIKDGFWPETRNQIERLYEATSREVESEVADFIDEKFSGFGPKQARNLLQGLGLTRYEIPIDSRITKWFNRFGFPVQLSATALADRDYYHFVSDGIQQLCCRSNVFPCVFDAAVFVSFDGDGWTEDNVGW